jgi:hypothetical protein
MPMENHSLNRRTSRIKTHQNVVTTYTATDLDFLYALFSCSTTLSGELSGCLKVEDKRSKLVGEKAGSDEPVASNIVPSSLPGEAIAIAPATTPGTDIAEPIEFGRDIGRRRKPDLLEALLKPDVLPTGDALPPICATPLVLLPFPSSRRPWGPDGRHVVIVSR